MQNISLVWIWPFVLTALVWVGCFLYTKNIKESSFYAFIAFLLGLACFSVMEFEIYLEGIFVGHYNDLGMPTDFSHSGWRLMIDAWPIWVVPLFIATLIKGFTLWTYMILKSAPPKKIAGTTGSNNSTKQPEIKNAQNQLAMQELKQKLDAALHKYEMIKRDRYQYETKIKQLELALVKAKKNPQVNAAQNEKLQEVIDEQNQEITEANELIEHLLQQLYTEDEATEKSDDFF